MSSPRRLSVIVAASESPDGEGADNFGTVYPEPFRVALEMWSFSNRAVEALCTHAWAPTQDRNTLHMVVTPSLATGTARVVEDADTYRRAIVGLSREAWIASSVADQRRMLIDLVVGQLEALHARFGLDVHGLHAAQRALVDGYGAILKPAGETTPIPVTRSVLAKLAVSSWRRAGPSERLAITRAVIDATRATGRQVDDPELTTLPGGECIVRARVDDVVMALVPGGTFHRGFDDPQLARVDRLFGAVWDHTGAGEPCPRVLTPFGSDAACNLADHGDAAIAPMWMASETAKLEDEPAPWDSEPAVGPVRWNRGCEVLAKLRMTLPTSDEALWAASAGDDRLFPWGDDISPIADLLGHAAESLQAMYLPDVEPPPRLERDPFEVFGRTNAFGLVAALADATWCTPIADLGEPTPMVYVGGALGFHPWQGSWEAMLFLTRVACRSAFDGRVGPARHAVRPIIRLGG